MFDGGFFIAGRFCLLDLIMFGIPIIGCVCSYLSPSLGAIRFTAKRQSGKEFYGQF